MAAAKKSTAKPAAPAAPIVAPAPAATKTVTPVMAAAPVVAAVPAKTKPTVEATPVQPFPGAHEAQEQFRKAVEQSVTQSRAAYEKLKTAAEQATGSLETSYSVATKGVNSLNAKAIDALKAQADVTMEHMKSVMAAKTVGEAIALQSTHARKQFETLSAQAKDFSEMMQKIAVEATEPLKAVFGKGFS